MTSCTPAIVVIIYDMCIEGAVRRYNNDSYDDDALMLALMLPAIIEHYVQRALYICEFTI